MSLIGIKFHLLLASLPHQEEFSNIALISKERIHAPGFEVTVFPTASCVSCPEPSVCRQESPSITPSPPWPTPRSLPMGLITCQMTLLHLAQLHVLTMHGPSISPDHLGENRSLCSTDSFNPQTQNISPITLFLKCLAIKFYTFLLKIHYTSFFKIYS